MSSNTFNSHILRTDERLSKVVWPALQKIDVPILRSSDCLLVCAGFEERAVVTLNRICESEKSDFTLGLIKYLPYQQENKIEQLRETIRRTALRVKNFDYNRENPSGMGEELRSFMQQFERVFVDISGMSRLLIVQTLVALLTLENHSVTLIYGAAEKYSPSIGQFNRDHNEDNAKLISGYLSTGIFEIAATPELSSISMLGEAIRLIAFPSFDPAQLTNLLQELQPAYTDFIHGIPPDNENKWRTDAIRNLNRLTLHELRGKRDHETSTLDYRETLHKLIEIYAERSMFDRFVVAPTGSKMQAVAVGLFRAALHDVQIVYPTPQVFSEPKEYTSGLRQLYQIDIPVEAFADSSNDSREDFSY